MNVLQTILEDLPAKSIGLSSVTVSRNWSKSEQVGYADIVSTNEVPRSMAQSPRGNASVARLASFAVA